MFVSSKWGNITKPAAVQAAVTRSADPTRPQRIAGAGRIAPACAPPFSAASGASAIVMTSYPRARRTRAEVVDGRIHPRQPRRFGAPTSTRVALRVAAYSAIASAAAWPSRVTVSAPSDSARRRRSIRRLRSASGSRRRSGVSTYTTDQWASSASAMRLPARTSCSDCASGPIATSTRSRASQGRDPGTEPSAVRAATSTRSATRRSASSRSAMRFGLRKNRSIAVATSSGTYTLPAFSRAIRSSGGRSMSSTSSACSKIRSGMVSRWRTPVIWATTSLRLSRCWMLTVVHTSMPASRISSMSCQRFGWRGGGSPPARLACASSSTSRMAGRRRSAASRSNSCRTIPRYRTGSVGSCSSPSISRSVSTRPCGSM